ncbi:MAG: hypothetical protein ACON5H_07670 [Akkermansiaceae bacterium]
MKTLFNLLFAIAILVVFGGTAFFIWDISKGARFERVDEVAPANHTDSPDRSEESK